MSIVDVIVQRYFYNFTALSAVDLSVEAEASFNIEQCQFSASVIIAGNKIFGIQ